MSRRFLALDQSLANTGWAVWDEGDDLPRSGSWGGGSIATRAGAFITLHREIAAIHREKPITHVAYEQPIKTPSDKVEKLIGLYGLAAHIESICHVKLLQPERIDVRSWRFTWLGPEKGRKGIKTDRLKQMAVEMAEHYGMEPETHDEAEAIGILDHHIHKVGIQPPWRIAHPILTRCG